MFLDNRIIKAFLSKNNFPFFDNHLCKDISSWSKYENLSCLILYANLEVLKALTHDNRDIIIHHTLTNKEIFC